MKKKKPDIRINFSKASYLSIKKTISTEECYILKTDISPEALELGLRTGNFNIVQVATVEPMMWVVDGQGKRIAILEKDGGGTDAEKVEIQVKY